MGEKFMMGNSIFGIDKDSNIHIGEHEAAIQFNATKGLWELLTPKKVDKDVVTADDL
jgi:hypothetical protein